MKNTPTPWTCEPWTIKEFIFTRGGKIIARISDYKNDDLSFIFRAVNNIERVEKERDELLEAAKIGLEWMQAIDNRTRLDGYNEAEKKISSAFRSSFI
jgi:hypothetical protein